MVSGSGRDQASNWSKVEVNLYTALSWYISKAPRYTPVEQEDHTVLPATHIRTIPAFTPQPQGVTHCAYPKKMTSLSWPRGWLHTDINVPHRELNPDTVPHPSTNRARRRLTSLIETNAPPLWQIITTCRIVCITLTLYSRMCVWVTEKV